MSKSDEYRENAAECQKMARLATNPAERVTWLEMAADWLRMIEKVDPSASDKFDAAEKAQGTHQERSEGEH
ncbi:MAG: hypothetical protein QOF14_2922 [Hyphomicrobiales bacterium]|jgi:hypothetical protein|nr:hypothetical protein [Hyphomicrobiales bacterium]